MADIGQSQRDSVKQMSPPWLANGFAEKFLYNFGVCADALLEKLNEAVQARMPTKCDVSALPFIGADRLIGQGPNESNANYRVRLQKAFDTWQQAGTRRAVLQQVLGYVANSANVQPYTPAATIVSASASGTYAVWDRYFYGDDTAAAPAHVRKAPANWNWDGTYTWWDSFLILHFPLVFSATALGTTASLFSAGSTGFTLVTGVSGMTSSSVGQFLHVSNAASVGNNGYFQIVNFVDSTTVWIANSSPGALPDSNNGSVHWQVASFPAIAPTLAWGSPGRTWGGDATVSWGLNVSSSYIGAMRGLVRLWKSANTFYPWIIFSFTHAATSPELKAETAAGAGNPDGTWGTWGKTVGGVHVPSRDAGQPLSKFDAFCDGTAIYQSCWTPSAG